jgi:hypothetical protein
MRRAARPLLPTVALSLVSFAPLLTGCASSGFGSELAATPAPLVIRETQPTTLRLPAETPFSIHLPQSTEQAGLQGTVDATAKVTKDGSASADAIVKNGGKGSATFQLGHVFRNETAQQLDLTIRVRYMFEFSVKNEPVQKLPDANLGIRLFARDARGRLLRDFDLIHHSTEQGAATRRSDEDLTFDVVLGVNESLSVFLAGQSSVDAPDGRSAESHLEIRQFSMEVQTRPSPAVVVPPSVGERSSGAR